MTPLPFDPVNNRGGNALKNAMAAHAAAEPQLPVTITRIDATEISITGPQSALDAIETLLRRAASETDPLGN